MMRNRCVVGAFACAWVMSVGSSFATVSVQSGAIESVAVSGGSAPGGGSLVYGGLGTFGLPRLNNLGEVVYTAQLATSGTSGTFSGQGVWAAVPQTSRLVFLQGGTVATPSGPFALSTGFSDPTINDTGGVATTCNGAVLVSAGGIGGVSQVVIKNGDPIASPPGTATVLTGGQFEFGGNPLLNNAGAVAVRIVENGPPAGPNILLMAGTAGGLSYAWRAGRWPRSGAA